MVLKILYNVGPAILQSQYYTHAVLALVTLVTIYTYAQGRKTNRERDLHGRTIIITGAFTPVGLTLLDALARRGAHLIALTNEPIDTGSPAVLIPLLRSTTNNENIYAEHCDIASPTSIRAFCAGFLKGDENRLDAVIFAHEYSPIGRLWGPKDATLDETRRAASCATFLLATSLLPMLLVAPTERDIRLITLINPFYAAAAPGFSVSPTPSTPPPTPAPLFLTEGRRALRTAILMRHLQRVLDALPSGAPAPRTDANATTIPVVSARAQASNIVVASVSPGFSRADVVAPLIGADATRASWRGLVLYFLLNPLLRLLTKSPFAAMQAVLHALFLPTPFKLLAATPVPDGSAEGDAQAQAATQAQRELRDDEDIRRDAEVLMPGALYAECAVVRLRVPPAPAPPENDGAGAEKAREQRADDGELGGEVLGTLVWEEYERELKAWEAAEKAREEREKAERESGRHTPPTVDVEGDTPAGGA